VPISRGEKLGPHLTQSRMGRGLPPYQVASSSTQPFGHNRQAENWGYRGGELGPYLAQCSLGRGLPPCQLLSLSIQPFCHNRHGRKLGSSAPLLGRGAGSPSNTMSLGPRPTSLPSGVLIDSAIWPQQIWAENWGCEPLEEGRWVPI